MKTLLEIHGLTKHYQSGESQLEVLKNIHLNLHRGEICVVRGPSGSGKSTLLGCIAGLDLGNAGWVKLLGHNLHVIPEEELALLRGKHIGFVFQSFRLLPTLTALENVQIPLDLQGDPTSREKALNWLARVGLQDRAHHLPTMLSGGEQQRVAIARAMVTKPDLILADEPTGNLDSDNGRKVLTLMLQLVKEHQASLMLVTHEEALLDCPHRVVQLQDGAILKDFYTGENQGEARRAT